MSQESFAENAVEGLSEPIAIFMGVSSQQNPRQNLTDDEMNVLVSGFEKYGIKATRFDTEQAKETSMLVISNMGIQTPFVPASEFVDTVSILNSIINEIHPIEGNKLRQHGFAHPVTIGQMMESVSENETERYSFVGRITNPNPQKTEDIMQKHGHDFIQRMLDKAQNLPDANLDESGLSFYNGSSFPQPYLIAPKTESRAVTYASEDYRIACDYSTGGTKYGFIKEFESTSEKITGYMDFGIENGEKPVIGNAYETPLYPGSSRLRNIILDINQDGQHTFKVIPQNNSEWQDFMELHRPGYEANPKMLHRRKNQKREAADGKLKTHSLISQMEEYNKIRILAEQRGISVEAMKKAALPTQHQHKSDIVHTEIQNKPQNQERKSGKVSKFIAKLRGLGKKENKAVTKTTLNIRDIKNKGKSIE